MFEEINLLSMSLLCKHCLCEFFFVFAKLVCTTFENVLINFNMLYTIPYLELTVHE